MNAFLKQCKFLWQTLVVPLLLDNINSKNNGHPSFLAAAKCELIFKSSLHFAAFPGPRRGREG